MARIEEAFDAITKEHVKISDYIGFRNNNILFSGGVRSLKCIECGDYITYCEGTVNRPYFKHSPTPEGRGHSFCSLYTEGVSSNIPECKFRKKIFEEENVSLNFELICINGKWKSLISLPPLKNSEIEEYEKNNTVITIGDEGFIFSGYYRDQFKINKENFSSGSVKKVTFEDFPEEMIISITGNSTDKDIFYKMSCFQPDCQIYSSLILQKYSTLNKDDNFIDLTNLPFFSCKKIDGNLYVGEHYIIFSYFDPIYIFGRFDGNISLKEIKFKKFKYRVYDIVFNEINDDLKKILIEYNCVLVERITPKVIWPPINRVGNYCYFKTKEDSNSKLFLTYYDKSNIKIESMSLTYSDKRAKSFLKILKNERPFYISHDNRKNIEKKVNQRIEESDIESNDKFYSYYSFKNDILISNINRNDFKNNDDILYFNNQLDRYYKKKLIDKNEELNEFLDIVRYSRKYEKIDKEKIKILLEKYKNYEEIYEFLLLCLEIGTIKSDAMKFLVERS